MYFENKYNIIVISENAKTTWLIKKKGTNWGKVNYSYLHATMRGFCMITS